MDKGKANPPLSQIPALPGIHRLDFDVTFRQIVRVESFGQTIRLFMADGDGELRGNRTLQATGTFNCALHWYSHQQFGCFMDALRTWKQTNATIRVTSAPGHATVMWGPDTALIWPRS